MIKLIASNGEEVILERDDRWGIVSVVTGVNLTAVVMKKEFPKWYESCIKQWGYVELTEPVSIERLDDITLTLLNKIAFLIEKKKKGVK